MSRSDTVRMSFRGHDFLIPDDEEQRYWHEDEQEIRDRFWHIEPGDVVIDVGANEGSYTIPALACGATVYAVDLNPSALTVVSACAELNGFEALRTVVVALYDGTGSYPKELVAEVRRWDTFLSMVPSKDEDWSTLDVLVSEYDLDRLDWIKIDVEGGELGVLIGGLATLKRFHPSLIIEDHTLVYPSVAASHSTGKILTLLDGLGYEAQTVHYQGSSSRSPARSYICAQREVEELE